RWSANLTEVLFSPHVLLSSPVIMYSFFSFGSFCRQPVTVIVCPADFAVRSALPCGLAAACACANPQVRTRLAKPAIVVFHSLYVMTRFEPPCSGVMQYEFRCARPCKPRGCESGRAGPDFF